MVYIFTEEDLEWKWVVSAENLETATKLLEKELRPHSYKLRPQKGDDWRIDVFKGKKLAGTLGVAERPFEMNQVY